jgi:Beta propeller domain/Dockerin type I domain/Bacterial Ig domain
MDRLVEKSARIMARVFQQLPRGIPKGWRQRVRFSLENLESRRVFDCSAEGYSLNWNWIDDTAVTTEGSQGARINVLDNDLALAVAHDSTRITAVTPGVKGGQVAISEDRMAVEFTPATGYIGSDCFTYVLDNGQTGTISMWVGPAVQTGQDTFSFWANPTLQTRTLNPLSNDIFPSDYQGARRITSVNSFSGDTIEISEDGQSLRFTPASTSAGYFGFQYKIDDKYEGWANVVIQSHAVGDQFTINANGHAKTLDVLANDTFQVPGEEVYTGAGVITAVGSTSSNAQVVISSDGRRITYTPDPGFSGVDYFTYTVDGIQEAGVQVNVLQRARADVFHVARNSSQNGLNVLLNDRVGAGYTGAGRITAVTVGLQGGTATISADGRKVVYSPAVDYQGVDTLTYTLDGEFVTKVTIQVGTPRAEALPNFENLQELKENLTSDALERYQALFGQPASLIQGHYGYYAFDLTARTFPNNTHPNLPTTGTPTNNQVAGVEEGDIVESDGEHLYVLRGQELIIARVQPAEHLEIISRTSLAGSPVAMYLTGNRLTVITTDSAWFGVTPNVPTLPGGLVPFNPIVPALDVTDDRLTPLVWDGLVPPINRDPSVTVAIYDVTSEAAPAVVQSTKLDGTYQGGRLLGGHVFVTAQGKELVLPQPAQVPAAEGGFRYETQAEYLSRLSRDFGEIIEDLLPQYTSYDGSGNSTRAGAISVAEEIYKPLDTTNRQMLSVVSLDTLGSNPGIVDSSTVMGSSASQMYGASENLYLFDYGWNSSDTFTKVTKFHWDGETGQIEFAARGAVPGNLNNQFSADEHDGHLRIVTTTVNFVDDNNPNGRINDLWVFRDQEGVMELTGAARDIAPGEQLQSARFDGDRGFLVTFEQVDPLFTLDLSDPANPQVLGELVLPGFSSYIQMLDETHLVGIGPSGNNGSIQVTLFDVSDMSAPIAIDKFEIGTQWSHSAAQHDSHAFGWYPEHGTLALPVTTINEFGASQSRTIVVSVDLGSVGPSDDGLVLRGFVEHAQATSRTSVIDGVLYTIGEGGIQAVDIRDPSQQIGSLDFGGFVPPQGSGGPTGSGTATPRDDSDFGPAILQAKASLAASMNLDVGELGLVTAETIGTKFAFVFRHGERHYFVTSHGDGSILSVEDDFAFMPANMSLDWHNEQHATDVNGDGFVGPLDALLIINELTDGGGRLLSESTSLRNIQNTENARSPKFIDVDKNGYVSPLDALRVINSLSEGGNNRAASGIAVDSPDSDSDTKRAPIRAKAVEAV